MTKNVHIVPNWGEWAVTRDGGNRNIRSFPTQQDAINYATPLAKKGKDEFMIHRPDVRIRDKRSYGNDPFPPQG